MSLCLSSTLWMCIPKYHSYLQLHWEEIWVFRSPFFSHCFKYCFDQKALTSLPNLGNYSYGNNQQLQRSLKPLVNRNSNWQKKEIPMQLLHFLKIWLEPASPKNRRINFRYKYFRFFLLKSNIFSKRGQFLVHIFFSFMNQKLPEREFSSFDE